MPELPEVETVVRYIRPLIKGRFRNKLEVFGRQGQACKRCKTKIKKIKLAQRGTHYCPRCQRTPKTYPRQFR